MALISGTKIEEFDWEYVECLNNLNEWDNWEELWGLNDFNYQPQGMCYRIVEQSEEIIEKGNPDDMFNIIARTLVEIRKNCTPRRARNAHKKASELLIVALAYNGYTIREIISQLNFKIKLIEDRKIGLRIAKELKNQYL